MKIVVGSSSQFKLNAVQAMFPDAEVIGVGALSGVPAQPMQREIWDGAKNRANNARNWLPDADLYIGIENGIFETAGGYFDMAAICWMSKQENYQSHYCFSEQVRIEKMYVDEARERGFNNVTVGMVMKENGVIEDANDPHKSLTGISREEYLKKALAKIPVAVIPSSTNNYFTRGAILVGTVVGFFAAGYLASEFIPAENFSSPSLSPKKE